MVNRSCVIIDKEIYPINNKDEIIDIIYKPKRLGDDAVIRLMNRKEMNVRLLQSSMMVNNKFYLVDLKNKECWPYD